MITSSSIRGTSLKPDSRCARFFQGPGRVMLDWVVSNPKTSFNTNLHEFTGDLG